MSKITFLAVGSRGDFNPACILGQSLKQEGYQVCIATHNRFRDFVLNLGLEFATIAGDFQELLNSEAGLDLLEGKSGSRLIDDALLLQQLEDSYAACKGSDLIIAFPLSFFGYHIAEALNIYFMAMSYIPVVGTRDFPFLGFHQRKSGTFQRLLNLFSYKLAEFLLWNRDRQVINTFRQKLDLPPISFRGVASRQDIPPNLTEIPIVHNFSDKIIPRPQDWADSVYVTGYLLSKLEPNYQPPTELKDFIEEGNKPVYVGFGSMAVREPKRITNTIIEALAESNQRAILLSGWASLGTVDLPDNVYLLKEYVPFAWLFPQMAALIHHGGSGTVSLGLHSGIPQVIVPFFADQPAWGKTLQTLGVAPPPIPIKELTAEKLSKAINMAVTDSDLKEKAMKIAANLESENGVRSATKIVQKYLPV